MAELEKSSLGSEEGGSKRTWIVVAVLVAAFVGIFALSTAKNDSINYRNFDTNQMAEADEATGFFGEMVIGSKDASVIIYEYGNYECTACAPMNPYINELVEEYKGKVAVVFRWMDLPDHDNGMPAASAALAAAKQGYWKEYKDLLFKNQADWTYATGTERQNLFESYMMAVSNEKADLEQFRADMGSKEVKQKIKYDNAMASKVGAEWSPYFVLDGENVSNLTGGRDEFLKTLREEIDKRLEDKK